MFKRICDQIFCCKQMDIEVYTVFQLSIFRPSQQTKDFPRLTSDNYIESAEKTEFGILLKLRCPKMELRCKLG